MFTTINSNENRHVTSIFACDLECQSSCRKKNLSKSKDDNNICSTTVNDSSNLKEGTILITKLMTFILLVE